MTGMPISPISPPRASDSSVVDPIIIANAGPGQAPRLTGTPARMPSVSAILAIVDPRRAAMARRSVNQFMKQSYRNKQLVIVNGTGTSLLDNQHPWINEVMVDPLAYPNAAAMRNFGIDQSTGDWIMPWDDDDHSHPHRILVQMAHRQANCCVLLSHQVRMEPMGSMICVLNDDVLGLPCTALFPRDVVYYDPNMSAGEDVEILQRGFPNRRIVVPNDGNWFPGPILSIAFYHGLNTLTREQFFGRYADPRFIGVPPDGLTQAMFDYVAGALSTYGLEMSVKKVGPTSPPSAQPAPQPAM